MELTNLIKEKYPNKNYYSLNETLVNGKYVVKTFNGITVPSKKLAELEQFKIDFFASKGITHVSEYKAITQKTTTQQSSEVEVLSRNVPIAQVAAGNLAGGDINNLTEANKDLNDLNYNLVERLIDYGFGKDNILVEIPTSMVKGSTGVVMGKEEDYLVEVFDKEGQVNPIMLFKNFEIIEGRHRLFAAKKLGLPIKAYMPAQSPTVNDSEIRNTEDNTVSLPESKKSVANLIKDAKNSSTTREVKNAGRRKSKKSKVKKVTKSKTDIDNLNSGPIDTNCKE